LQQNKVKLEVFTATINAPEIEHWRSADRHQLMVIS
jgi:hypothetical protein